VSRPAITPAVAGSPASDAWWLSQVYNPLNYLYGMFPVPAVKAADTSRASTITTTDDPDLTLPVLANSTYLFEAFIAYTSAAVTGDFKLNFNAPTGATGYWNGIGPSTASVADPDSVRVIATVPGATSRTYGVPLASNVFGLNVRGSVITSTTAGSLTAQWAQATSDANATVVKAGSWLRLILASG
jgi:hypothetical protein